MVAKKNKKPAKKNKISKQKKEDLKLYYAPKPRKRIPSSENYVPRNVIGKKIMRHIVKFKQNGNCILSVFIVIFLYNSYS